MSSSKLSPRAPVFVPQLRQKGPPNNRRLPAPPAQNQEPPKPPYHWKAISPNTRLVYITDPLIADAEIAALDPKSPLGFDLEWKPTTRKKQAQNLVAVVQIANANTILLLHIHMMSAFPVRLQELLENPKVLKAGVAIQHDSKKLYRDYHVNISNCVDLSLLARSVDNARWKGKYTAPIGLARLCDVYQDLSLSKGSIRTSNWELPLSYAQQNYAANDCHVGLELYNQLIAMSLNMEVPPSASCYTFDCVSGNPYEHLALPLRPWRAYNPNYDPGPPPPKPPKKTNAPRGPKAKRTEHGFSRSPRGSFSGRNDSYFYSPSNEFEHLKMLDSEEPRSAIYTSDME